LVAARTHSREAGLERPMDPMPDELQQTNYLIDGVIGSIT
jgi:hypothetical protein